MAKDFKSSIWLKGEAAEALKWLKKQPGGFNLSLAIHQLIVNTAKKRGWKGKRDEKP
jgi:hypothetical protein